MQVYIKSFTLISAQKLELYDDSEHKLGIYLWIMNFKRGTGNNFKGIQIKIMPLASVLN